MGGSAPSNRPYRSGSGRGRKTKRRPTRLRRSRELGQFVEQMGSTLVSVLAREHATLLQMGSAVVADLHGFEGRLRRRLVVHFQHDVFAERARSLAIYLSSALRLADADEYISAFAILRAALEHHLTDRLLFVGNRYTQQYTGVKKPDYEQLEMDRAQGRPGTENIIRVHYDSGTMVVVRSGLHMHDEAGRRRRQTLSIYYFLLDQFDPFVGTPDEQQHLSRGFTKVEDRIRHAEEQQGIYGRQLRWRGLKANLRENRLFSNETLRRFEVHYRFLSAFVHPVPAGYDLVYGRNRPTGAPRYDHYASELTLLYINKLASAELKFLKRMTTRTPRVRLNDWTTVEAHIRAADAAAEHLWFPGDDVPHAYDRFQEANSRAASRGKRLIPANRRPAPEDLQARHVRYYRNPLRRLIDMHQSVQELTTGFAYISPWPREDARFR
jgi:hypothetical protein